MCNETAALENILAISCKGKTYIYYTAQQYQLLGICPWKIKTYILPRNLYANIYSNFIHNHQKLKITQMSIIWWKDKL